MKEDFTNHILDKLEKELHIKGNNDFIGDLFEKRAEEFHTAIIKNDEYRKVSQKINSINEKILTKYDNALEIINEIENYIETTSKRYDLLEKQMYKLGVYDGMRIIIEGMKIN